MYFYGLTSLRGVSKTQGVFDFGSYLYIAWGGYGFYNILQCILSWPKLCVDANVQSDRLCFLTIEAPWEELP